MLKNSGKLSSPPDPHNLKFWFSTLVPPRITWEIDKNIMPKPHSQRFWFNWTRLRMTFKLEFWAWELGVGVFKSFPGVSPGFVVKSLPASAGDKASVPGLGRSPHCAQQLGLCAAGWADGQSLGTAAAEPARPGAADAPRQEKHAAVHAAHEWPVLAAAGEEPTRRGRPSTAKNKWMKTY